MSNLTKSKSIKGANTMSKEQANGSTTVSNLIKKVYKYFDLETLENKEQEVEIPFSPATTLEEATERIGNDSARILLAINTLLRQEALTKAETDVISKGGKRSVVLAIMKPFRSMPPFNSYFVLDNDGKKTFKTRKLRNSDETITEPVMNRERQDKEILAMLKANPVMLESIKKASLEAIGTDDTEEEDA